MIKVENTEVLGWGHAIRGMRNPLNSWDKMDSHDCPCHDGLDCDCPMVENDHEPAIECNETLEKSAFCVGEKDYDLMMRLAKAGPEHAKYRRMIVVYADVTAPLYWWKEYDTYKVGTVANSCSTMHKIAAKEFTLEDFSHEHLISDESIPTRVYSAKQMMEATIENLNIFRNLYLQTKDKKYWWQIIQMLPSSYNQRRTVMLNYEVLANIYRQRKGHKLDEWRTFCTWIEQLPYSELISGKEAKENG
jgi:hypothetical protein